MLSIVNEVYLLIFCCVCFVCDTNMCFSNTTLDLPFLMIWEWFLVVTLKREGKAPFISHNSTSKVSTKCVDLLIFRCVCFVCNTNMCFSNTTLDLLVPMIWEWFLVVTLKREGITPFRSHNSTSKVSTKCVVP